MIKIVAERGKGKTTDLIRMSAQTGNFIVCKDANNARDIQLHAQKLGLKIPFPLTFDEFLSDKYYGKGVKGFLIDNADILLQSITNVPIHAITMRK